MKSNPFHESVQTELARRTDLVTEITSLKSMEKGQAEILKTLETDGDITTRETLDKITLAQTFVALLPRRIAAREQSLETAGQTLTKAVHEFIVQAISPRARQLSERTRAKVKQSLAPLFSDPVALDAAIHRSDAVMILAGISPSVTTPESRGGVVRYSQDCLEVWNKLDAIEANLA